MLGHFERVSFRDLPLLLNTKELWVAARERRKIMAYLTCTNTRFIKMTGKVMVHLVFSARFLERQHNFKPSGFKYVVQLMFIYHWHSEASRDRRIMNEKRRRTIGAYNTVLLVVGVVFLNLVAAADGHFLNSPNCAATHSAQIYARITSVMRFFYYILNFVLALFCYVSNLFSSLLGAFTLNLCCSVVMCFRFILFRFVYEKSGRKNSHLNRIKWIIPHWSQAIVTMILLFAQL